MKKLLLCFSALAIIGFANAQTFVSENFNSTAGTALPSGWTQSGTGWKTGTPATINSQSFGIPATTDGRALGINDDASQSSAFNNELVQTAEYDLTDGTEDGLFLKMDLVFPGATYQGNTETFKIEASIDGGATWTVLETVPGYLDFLWHVKYVSLGDYAGESSVKLGFRYNDGSGWLYGAGIDNFSILNVPGVDAQLSVASPVQNGASSYGAVGAPINITGTVFNNGGITMTSYTVKYQQGSNEIQSYTKTINVPAFTSDNFTHSVPFTIPSVGEFPISVWVEVDGDEYNGNDTLSAFVQGVEFIPTKRLLFEEATGTWCGWCPRGTVAMDEFALEHPGAAAQVAVHNDDPMEVAAYDSFIAGFIDGYPSMVVDRTFTIDPGDILEAYEELQGAFGYANITMGDVSVSGSNVATVPVTINPAVDINNAKIVLIVTESNLSGTGSAWNQVNYYAGGAQGPMGGFENAPQSVPNTQFHFVARSASPAPAGATANVPAAMTAGGSYSLDLTTTLNSSWNQSNIQYVVALLGSDGKALNTAISATPTLNPIFASVENIDAGISKMEVYPNPARDVVTLSFDLKATTDLEIQITDMNGKIVDRIYKKVLSGSNRVELQTAHLSNGLYTITTNTGKGIASLRLVVEH